MCMLLLAGLYLSEIQNVVYSADEGGRGHFDLRCQKKKGKNENKTGPFTFYVRHLGSMWPLLSALQSSRIYQSSTRIFEPSRRISKPFI